MNGSRAPECADEAMRDALPSLDHGRLPAAERQAVEAHVAVCAYCAVELTLLRDLRASLAATAPRVDLERIALAVAASTRPAVAEHADVVPIAPRLAARARGWMRPGGLRAAAAALLTVAGVGAVTMARRGGQPAAPPSVVASAPGTDTVSPTTPAAGTQATATSRADAAPARAAHALGEQFDDLSDAELHAVLLAIDDEDAELPALEPAVHASEYRGGGA
jgi:hypothetical protein